MIKKIHSRAVFKIKKSESQLGFTPFNFISTMSLFYNHLFIILNVDTSRQFVD